MAVTSPFCRSLAHELVAATPDLVGHWFVERLRREQRGEPASTVLAPWLPALVHQVAAAVGHAQTPDLEMEATELDADQAFDELASLDWIVFTTLRRRAAQLGCSFDEFVEAIERCYAALAGIRRTVLEALAPGDESTAVSPALAERFCRSINELRQLAQHVADPSSAFVHADTARPG